MSQVQLWVWFFFQKLVKQLRITVVLVTYNAKEWKSKEISHPVCKVHNIT